MILSIAGLTATGLLSGQDLSGYVDRDQGFDIEAAIGKRIDTSHFALMDTMPSSMQVPDRSEVWIYDLISNAGLSYAAMILAELPSAYYRLNDSGTTARDWSGSGRIGTPSGTITKGVAGGLNDGDTAMEFTVSSSISLANFTGVAGGQLSVEAWVMFPGGASGNWDNFANRGWVGDGWLLFMDVAKIPYFGVGKGGSQYNANGSAISNLTVGHHLVGTYDGATVRVYVDGVLGGTTAAIAGAATDTTTAPIIGGGGTASKRIDEVAIYPYALTPAQIARHYAMGLACLADPQVTDPTWSISAYNTWRNGAGTESTSPTPANWTPRLFGGYVATPKYTHEGPQRYVQVACQDYTTRLRTTVTNMAFAAGNTDQSIVKQLFARYRSDYDTTNVAVVTPSFPAITYPVHTLEQCMERIIKVSRGYYRADYYKQFWYGVAGQQTAPFNLSDDPNYGGFRSSFENLGTVQRLFKSIGNDATGTLNYWTKIGAPSIASNQLTLHSNTDQVIGGHPDLWDCDENVQFTFNGDLTGFSHQLRIHQADSNNFIRVDLYQGVGLYISKTVNGVGTSNIVAVGFAALTSGTKYWLRFQAVGTTYIASLYADSSNTRGTLIATCQTVIPDASVQSGQMVLYTQGSNACVWGSANPNVCTIDGPTPLGWTIHATWTSYEPAFCWSKKSPFSGTYSLSTYSPFSIPASFVADWWSDSVANVPGQIVTVGMVSKAVPGAGTDMRWWGATQVLDLQAINDSTWHSAQVNGHIDGNPVFVALSFNGIGTAYFDNVFVSPPEGTIMVSPPTFPTEALEYTPDGSGLANRVWVIGSTYLSAVQAYQVPPALVNGTAYQFPLPGNPEATGMTITVGGVDQGKIGVSPGDGDVTTPSSFKYNTLIQHTPATVSFKTPPGAGVAVIVTGQFRYPLVQVVTDSALIAATNSVVFEAIVRDKRINDASLAKQVGQAYLKLQGSTLKGGKCITRTRQAGGVLLQPGHVITIKNDVMFRNILKDASGNPTTTAVVIVTQLRTLLDDDTLQPYAVEISFADRNVSGGY